MEGIEVLIVILGFITFLWGSYVIVMVSLSCWAERSTRTFFKDIWSGMAGLWIVVIPLMVLSLPIFLLLTLAIACSGERMPTRSTPPTHRE